MKKSALIIGDSYSTFKGYIPENYLYYYGGDDAHLPKLCGVEETWWHRLVDKMGLKLILNDSYSGSTVCNTVREGYPLDSSFIRRFDRLADTGFFSENRVDYMFVFGGTNDSWIDSPVGENMYADWTNQDLLCVLPAFCYLLHRMTTQLSKTSPIVILNSELKNEITDNMAKACEVYGVKYVRLSDIEKINGHPTSCGMAAIAAQVEHAMFS